MRYFDLTTLLRTVNFVPVLVLISIFGLSLVELPLQAADEILVAKVESVEKGHVIRIEWKAPTSKIASLPEWTIKDSALPLSLDQAIKITLGEVQKKFPDITGWKFGEAHLFEITNDGNDSPAIKNKYYYLINFAPLSDADMQSIKQQKKDTWLSQVVLLDGTVLASKASIRNLGE